MSFDETNLDPIDQFLGALPAPDDSVELRQSIQNKTLAVIRRRRRLRRIGWMTGLAACYGAGILTTWVFNVSQPEPTIANQQRLETGVVEADKVPAGPKVETNPVDQLPDTALAMEWQAWDSESRRPELFRLAGDKYLQGNDLESATRCYRGALRNASEKVLEVTVNDTWLYMSLKQAKQEENRYAKLISQ
jgi:hypothetical protein